MDATCGRGVDIALNSLTGELLSATVDCLAEGGTFVEIGKTEYLDAGHLPRSIAYRTVALDVTCREEPMVIRRLLSQIVTWVESGKIGPLPVTAFSRDELIDAFRFMSQAKHVGKVVVFHQGRGRSLESATGTCLVTGGLGGLGLLTARELVARGWKSLALVGRREPTAEASAELESLRRLGARIEVYAADVSDASAMSAVVASAKASLPPIRGVIHAAGVLDDRRLVDLEVGEAERIMRPKVEGGRILHELFAREPIEFFILYSSIASELGSTGQCPYGMANAYLDALARHRRRLGLPALTVNWGPWAERGMAARSSPQTQASWSRRGLALLSPTDAFTYLERALQEGVGQAIIAQVDWSLFAEMSPGNRAFLSLLTRESAMTASNDVADVRSTPTVAASGRLLKPQLVDLIRAETAKVLGCEICELTNSDQPLRELGVDSLMAMDLALSLGRIVKQPVPRNLLKIHPTIDALANFLDRSISGEKTAPTSTTL
jgi:NAD(P)-dependent dehydrogenase (short-subunit alcohol dehydrogenase family)/acyl carrier protein